MALDVGEEIEDDMEEEQMVEEHKHNVTEEVITAIRMVIALIAAANAGHQEKIIRTKQPLQTEWAEAPSGAIGLMNDGMGQMK